MTEPTSGAPSGSPPGKGGQAQTMRFQSAANVVMRGLLRAPGISRGIGKQLLTLHVVGRKSGKHYDVPVAYLEHEGRLIVGTPFPWVKNLRTGEPIEVHFKGQRRTADVEVVEDEAGVVRYWGLMCRHGKQFADFNRVARADDGTPNDADLHAAWRNGGRAVLLTLR